MLEIETLLSSFDWTHPIPCATRLESLLTDELESVESENVRALVMNDGPQMHDFISRLDNGVKQCEELDEILTIYLVELQALADDVNVIESENRGLHVRTANERALEKDLSDLLAAMTISPREFDVLKQESLEKKEGIDRVEQSLLQLYRALKASSGLAIQHDADGIMENMQIVREMRRMTRQESEKFLARLREFVKIKFQVDFLNIVLTYRLNSWRSLLGNRNRDPCFQIIPLHIPISIAMRGLYYLRRRLISTTILIYNNSTSLQRVNPTKMISGRLSHNGKLQVGKLLQMISR